MIRRLTHPGGRCSRVNTLWIAASIALSSGVPVHAQGDTTRARVAGTVRDSAGAAISGAQLTVVGGSARATTDLTGRYLLVLTNADRTTEVRLDVRRLGFHPRTLHVSTRAGATTTLEIVLAAVPSLLPSVVIGDHREVWDSRLAGYNERRTKKVGHFITRDQIERQRGFGLVDLLRTEPGVRVINLRGGSGRSIVMRGGNCPPLVFVDGFPASAAAFDLDMINLSTVEGIEIYSSGTSVPGEFVGPRGQEQCGVIALWSRPFRPRTATAETKEEDRVPIQPLIEKHAVLTAEQVDRVARLVQGSVPPVYPESLWQAKTPGVVVAEFVVDTAGLVLIQTIEIVSSTHVSFADAVRTALAIARFEPAMLRDRLVPQAVRMKFDFVPSIPSPSSDSLSTHRGTNGSTYGVSSRE